MKFYKLIISCLPVVILISWLTSSTLSHKANLVPHNFKRNYINSVTQVASADLLNYDGEQVRCFGGKIYIKEFNPNRFLLHAFSDGKSQVFEAVGQSRGLITGWGLYEDRFFTADMRNHFIEEKVVRSGTVQRWPLSYDFTRIAFLQPERYLVKAKDSSGLNEKFLVVNLKTKSVKDFGNLLIDYNDGGFGNDGYFIRNEEGRVFHISYYQSDIIAFDNAGTPLYKARTIDKSATAPATIRSASGTRFISSMATVINRTAAANTTYLFVASTLSTLAEAKAGKTSIPVIDLYNTLSGQYKGSLQLIGLKGKKIKSLAVTNDRLYCLASNQIITFNIESLNPDQKKKI